MILYRLTLIKTQIERKNPHLTDLLNQYYTFNTSGSSERAALANNIRTMQADPTLPTEEIRTDIIQYTKQYIPLEQITKIKVQQGDLPSEYYWKQEEEKPLLLIPKNLFVIEKYLTFCKHNFYGRLGVFLCRGCEEKVKGYFISEHNDRDNIRNYTILVSFCFSCEHLYRAYAKKREQVSMIGFATKALRNARITVRTRGGGRSTLDQLNGVNPIVLENMPIDRYGTDEAE
jgi:hypothetical protein